MDISFQLYSGRNYPLAEVLKTVSRAGYTQVEGYGGLDAASGGLGGLYGDLKSLKLQLDDNGLSMPTAHVGLDLLEQPDRAMTIADALGTRMFMCPWLAPSQRPADANGWAGFGERLARIGEPYQKAGITFGYHNHDFEFATLPDGRYPMNVLLDAAPVLQCELDVAWVVRGKADPKPWIEQYGGRIAAVHVKDLAPAGQNADEDGWADVGQGILPWADLFKTIKAKSAARYFVAEHDNPSDIERFATRSIAAIKSFGA
ncbi:MAG TPA: sugar phosphate isomerase/epimerase [Devosiaceae bacterium]|jgi:sugar phosphate isomerase/epimerase